MRNFTNWFPTLVHIDKKRRHFELDRSPGTLKVFFGDLSNILTIG